MMKYKIMNHCNFEEDVPFNQQEDLHTVFEELAGLGWNSIQWGNFSIKMKKDSFPKVMHSKSNKETLENLVENTEYFSNNSFVEIFGDKYSNYLRGDAGSLLNAAKICLEKAIKMNRCKHPSLIEGNESFKCPDCKMERYKTIEEVINQIDYYQTGKWELQIMSYLKSLEIITLQGEVILNTTNDNLIKSILIDESNISFLVEEEKDVSEEVEFFGMKDIVDYRIKKGIFYKGDVK